MLSRKKISGEEIKNIGLRIKACRTLIGLTQEEFGAKSGIPTPSIKTWEFGGVIPKVEGLKKFCDFFKEEGISVSINWILCGDEIGPSYLLNQGPVDTSTGLDSAIDDFDKFKEVYKDYCKKNKKNPVLFRVKDEEMYPFYCKGDLIAGYLLSKDNFSSSIGKPVIVKLTEDNYAIRFLHKVDQGFLISSVNNKNINKIDLDFFGLIAWHRVN